MNLTNKRLLASKVLKVGRNRIKFDSKRLSEIKEAMKTSGAKGMQIFDDALLSLYHANRISLEEALRNADSRNDLEAKINFG